MKRMVLSVFKSSKNHSHLSRAVRPSRRVCARGSSTWEQTSSWLAFLPERSPFHGKDTKYQLDWREEGLGKVEGGT